ncbi:macrolide family glycosyltransferase [Saccharothrix algeriensis]|uniref:MGT family glycosyltransferase n=1 Tax=Saccharothrix algeriensis TaxID=173560 RepID=A0ABS2S3P2_9PSEU|nr:macrolide family glycosyltransferase [Saccharothrix algeriensis]MBM7810857.1 MGT family glycosyltransferase [Saccharothrix algeriensis]
MSHIAFLNIPGHGHVNPTLPVVAELVARGHRVTYAVPEGFTAAVEHAGATALGHPTTLPADDREWPTEAAPAMRLFLAEAVAVLPLLAAACADDRPDAVVHDIGAWTGRVLAARWGVPAIQFSPTFVAYEGWEEDMGPINDTPEMKAVHADIGAWLRAQGVTMPVLEYVGHPDRAIVSITRSFQRGDVVADKYAFVGPCLGDRSFQGSWQPPADGRPVLLVSLGSAYTDDPAFYRACLAAFGGSEWHVVVNIGAHVDPAELGDVPAGVELHRRVPQLEILSHAKVFVTHCGMGGTMEALYHGVPMIGVPTIGEQVVNAARVAELGYGRHLPREQVTPEALRAAARELADDPEVAARLAAARAEVRSAGGAAAAADVVERALR